jgi:transposase
MSTSVGYKSHSAENTLALPLESGVSPTFPVRGARTSIIAGLNEGKAVVPMMFEGYCNTDVVKGWVEEMLLTELKPGQSVIGDNARFHQSPEFKTLIESTGCTLIYLPTYSPDLNPIEKWWAKLKAWIRRLRTKGVTLKLTLLLAFQKMSRAYPVSVDVE